MNKGKCKGKIYKLYNEGGTYYGSTILRLSQRLTNHKSHKNCSSRILFDPKFSDPKIELIEEFYYDDIKELRNREAYYIQNLECVNKRIPNRTKKEYYQNNKEKAKQTNKKYYLDNKEDLIQINKKYYENHKDIISEKKKIYYEQHKEQKKQYYLDNKKKISEQIKLKITCECGSVIRKGNLSQHRKTNIHQKYLTTKAHDDSNI